MSWFEIKTEIPPASAPAAGDRLAEIGLENWSLLEDAIAGRAWVCGLFPDEAGARAQWAQLLPSLPSPPLSDALVRPLPDSERKDSYKAHFHAWTFGRLHWVPVWEREAFVLPAGDAVLWLDPGLAFGTGNHETTRLCIERLAAYDAGLGARARIDQRVIDAGCGSGILALSAAVLGFGHVAGFDNDPEAVRISRQNAALNGLAGSLDLFQGDLESGLARRTADVLLANIQSDILIRGARQLTDAVAPGGRLILSGILATELASVRAGFGTVAPAWPVDSRTLGEWSDLVLRAPV